MSAQREPFGSTPDGQPVHIYTLRDKIEAAVSNLGGALVSCRVPDRNGSMADVVLGYDSADGYLNDRIYAGSIVGRYANRIAHGRFSLDGVSYTLARNNGPNSLHGGDAGFHDRLWDAEMIDGALRLRLNSEDGAGGFPGTLHVEVTYAIEGADLRIEYLARSEAPTVINLTNHAYFNLAGVEAEGPVASRTSERPAEGPVGSRTLERPAEGPSPDSASPEDPLRGISPASPSPIPGAGRGTAVLPPILDHLLEIDASRYTPVDETQIPTGVLAPVAGTPFDFRTAVAIGERIDDDDAQLRYGGGYDHNFVLNGDGTLRRAARVEHPPSGRMLEVWTTHPGLQFYAGNSLDGTVIGKSGVRYDRRTGFCLETQHFPDSPNQPTFPSTVLRPGEVYLHTTVYRFSTR